MIILVCSQDLSVKLAATKALGNALEFAEKNFKVDAERNYIMTVICEACTSGNDEVKEHAFQCLCRIAEVNHTACLHILTACLSSDTQSVCTLMHPACVYIYASES
jgi:hypothetical protein